MKLAKQTKRDKNKKEEGERGPGNDSSFVDPASCPCRAHVAECFDKAELNLAVALSAEASNCITLGWTETPRASSDMCVSSPICPLPHFSASRCNSYIF